MDSNVGFTFSELLLDFYNCNPDLSQECKDLSGDVLTNLWIGHTDLDIIENFGSSVEDIPERERVVKLVENVLKLMKGHRVINTMILYNDSISGGIIYNE